MFTSRRRQAHRRDQQVSLSPPNAIKRDLGAPSPNRRFKSLIQDAHFMRHAENESERLGSCRRQLRGPASPGSLSHYHPPKRVSDNINR